MCPPPPLLRVGGKDMFVPPHFQTQNLSLGIGPTDICDVILAWLASRCWAPSDVPPPPHFVTFLRRWLGICLPTGFKYYEHENKDHTD